MNHNYSAQNRQSTGIQTEEKASASSPELRLWLAVLLRAIEDARMLHQRFLSGHGIVNNHVFYQDVFMLRKWFLSKKMEDGSISWICSLFDCEPDSIARRATDRYLNPIINWKSERIKNGLPIEDEPGIVSGYSKDFTEGTVLGAWTVQYKIDTGVKTLMSEVDYMCLCVCGNSMIRNRKQLLSKRHNKSCHCKTWQLAVLENKKKERQKCMSL